MRIQKYISQKGLASRREAERLISEGKVYLNGKRVSEMGVLVDPDKDEVLIKGLKKDSKKSVLVNKPRGVVSSKSSEEGKNVFDVFPEYKDLNTLGRLDKESEGLLILSNDGVLARKITGEDHSVEKEYEVTVRENIFPGLIKRLEPGILIDGQKTLPVSVELIDKHRFRIVMREGRRHQIRRMCDFLKLTVLKLVRVRIAHLTLKSLAGKKSKELSIKEVDRLKNS